MKCPAMQRQKCCMCMAPILQLVGILRGKHRAAAHRWDCTSRAHQRNGCIIISSGFSDMQSRRRRPVRPGSRAVCYTTLQYGSARPVGGMLRYQSDRACPGAHASSERHYVPLAAAAMLFFAYLAYCRRVGDPQGRLSKPATELAIIQHTFCSMPKASRQPAHSSTPYIC